jgi:Fe-S cluster assembly scaffold protein SufB
VSPEDAKEKRGEDIKRDLDAIVELLNQGEKSSAAWDSSVSDNPEEWEQLKRKIAEKQRALKLLVDKKKAGLIGVDEFDAEYREIQDELTKLEFAVYNMKLGTKVE